MVNLELANRASLCYAAIMNAPVLTSLPTEAKFTVAQIWALIEKGVANRDAKFELLDGEVIPLSPKGPLHEEVRRDVMRWLKTLPSGFDVLAETTLYLDKTAFVEPDYVVFDAGLAIKDLTPEKVRLAIEVGHNSWSYDIGEKATRYAAHGVPEYWAIHAPTRMTRLHRAPGAAGWGEVRQIPAGEPVNPLCAPDLALVLKI